MTRLFLATLPAGMLFSIPTIRRKTAEDAGAENSNHLIVPPPLQEGKLSQGEKDIVPQARLGSSHVAGDRNRRINFDCVPELTAPTAPETVRPAHLSAASGSGRGEGVRDLR